MRVAPVTLFFAPGIGCILRLVLCVSFSFIRASCDWSDTRKLVAFQIISRYSPLIFRTRSIVNVEGKIHLSRNQIVIESSDSLCRLDGQHHKWYVINNIFILEIFLNTKICFCVSGLRDFMFFSF